jgi:hypothetical protein
MDILQSLKKLMGDVDERVIEARLHAIADRSHRQKTPAGARRYRWYMDEKVGAVMVHDDVTGIAKPANFQPEAG